MNLQDGGMLAHYRLVEKLGQGGMGVVWRATDTTLGRDVAIKVLPEAFSGDPQRLARFEQEARLLASLNHPHIASVYSVHQEDKTHFLAMELVEGEDLAQRLSRGRLPLDEAMEIARQVAEALEAAHDRGVIHRDLKPANIQLTPAGKIKVLDFGLAKALAGDPASGDPSMSPTITSAGTVAGMILGTAGYMSPEQARGREVDRRADVWAFGCVLYEMLTGYKTFAGETISDTLAAVLKVDPDWDALPDDTPPGVMRMLRRCLNRDVERRLSHVSGARLDLMDALEGTGETVPTNGEAAAAVPGWKRALPWAMVVVLVAVAGWLAVRQPDPGSGAAREPVTLIAPFPDGQRIPSNQMGIMALSPDGRHLAVVLTDERERHLYLKRAQDGAMTKLEGTRNASTPFFSADGRWIGFFADDRLKKIAVDGGSPVTLCESKGDNRGATWTWDDRIVFARHYTEALMQVPGGGGTPVDLTSLDDARGERTHRWPHAVPGHDLVLFTVGLMSSPESYDGSRIDAVRPSTGEQVTVLEGASSAWYVESGHLVFAREGFLFAVPFDIGTLEARGSPTPVVEDVMGTRSSGVVYSAFAGNGLLAYITGKTQSREARMAWRSRGGGYELLEAPVSGYVDVRLSPDGKQIASSVEGEATYDIFTYDIERNALTRLTFEGDNRFPVWSPDGSKLAFASVRDDKLQSLYVKSADGSGVEQMLFSPSSLGPDAASTFPESWSPDGSTMTLNTFNKNDANLVKFTLGDSQGEMFLETPFAEQVSQISPDGMWLAYSSDETGTWETFVRPFDGSRGKWQISGGGGYGPRWSPDADELFYRWETALYSVKLERTSSGVRWARPEIVFDDLPGLIIGELNYDVLSSDRFLMVQRIRPEQVEAGITVVVNWLDDLARRVPTN
jgi:serine/threonine-protein kinase